MFESEYGVIFKTLYRNLRKLFKWQGEKSYMAPCAGWRFANSPSDLFLIVFIVSPALLCSVSRETAFLGSFANLSLLKSIGGTVGNRRVWGGEKLGYFLPLTLPQLYPAAAAAPARHAQVSCGSCSPNIVLDSGIR